MRGYRVPADPDEIALLRRTIEDLQVQLRDAREASRALAAGEIDAVAAELGSPPALLGAAQAGLRKREEVLRAVFDGTHDGMLLADEHGKIVDANPAACTMFGLSKDSLRGRSLAEFAAPEPGLSIPEWQARLEMGHLRGEFSLLRANGARLTLELSSVAGIISGLHLAVLRDVTERNAKEAALRQTSYLFEQAESVALVGHWVAPIDASRPLFWTKETYRILGLRDDAPLTRQTFFDTVLHPEDRASVEAALKEAIESGKALDLEHRIVRPDGDERWVHAKAIVAAGPNHEPQVVGTIQDITERRKADALLRASDERYRRIIETTSDGVWLSDAQYRTTFVNQRMAEMLGYTPEEMIGKEVFAFLTDEGAAIARQKFERRRQRGVGESYENSYRRKDGTTCWALARTNPIIEDGNFVGTVGLLTNLTDQRKVEEARDRLAAIVESSGDAIIGKALDGTITSWNRSAEKLFGYTAEEIIGQPSDILIPEYIDDDEQEALERLMNGAPVEYRDAVRRHKDGSLVVVAINLSLIRNAHGTVVGASKIARDISERRRQEAALKRSEEQLRQTQKLESIGSLAGGIAHDFNNILSVILGYTNLLLQEVSPKDPAKSDLDEIHKAGLRAAELTRHLLAFSRQQMLQPQVLDLNVVILGIQKMLARVLGEHIALTLGLSPTLGHVHADLSQVEQVLMNLVINARDAMPRGGTMTIETRNVVVDAAASDHGATPGSYALLVLTDTGTGMDSFTASRVFDPFFSTKEPGKGTGLGLSTVHGIVEQSGGHIQLRTELGKGTSFEVYLPITEQPLEEQPSVPPPAASFRGTETILLVEDEDHVRQLMRAILRKQGYEVLDAQNGGEAFLICEKRTSPINLLITDVIMPRMSGGELVELLLPRHPGLAVLFVSGYAKDAIVQHGVRDQGLAFLAKPITPIALASKVREVLDLAARSRASVPPRS